LVCQGRLDAYSQRVHRRITKEVIDGSAGRLNQYINNYTGLTKGVEDKIDRKRIRDWIEDGSWWEDVGLDILTSHFHNPLTNKGLTEPRFPDGESAYDRANNPHNYWSWGNARQLLYKGLTSTTKNEREKALADSFEALGHLMHLVQDMAVPAHTRDDMHGRGEPYEAYTDRNRDKLNFASEPFLYWNVSVSPSAPKQFWDLDSYNGEIAYDSGYIGLSEYTNANFLSKDTIFKEDTFPHPRAENTNFSDFGLIPISVITTSDKIDHKTFYISGYGKTHLAALKYFAEELWHLPLDLPWKKYKLTTYLDDRCHEEYAGDLIPRAVGYSAGFLDYFFRGTLEISVPDDQVFSIMEGIANPRWIMSIRAKAKNTTAKEKDSDGKTVSYEEMQKGELRAVLRYKKGSNDEYLYAVSKSISIGSLSTSDPTEFNFDFSDDPIPSGVRDASLFVIFKGTLGSEKDIAVAVGMRLLVPETIEITLPPKGVYAQTENPDQGFSEIKLLARNTGVPDITDGGIKLIVQYRLALENPFQSELVPISENIYYTVVPEKNGTRSIPRDNAVELTFDLSQMPIPLYATDLYLQVIYRGKLGAEVEALAVGLKDISEPTPMDIFGNTDFICLNNLWFFAGSPEAIAQVDRDGDGIAEPGEWDVYRHDLKDIYIRFSSTSAPRYASPSEYNFYIPYLQAGEFLRTGFILHDYQFNFGDMVLEVVPIDSNDRFFSYLMPSIFTSSAIKNQTRYGKRDDCCEALGIPHCMDYSEIDCCEKTISEVGCKIINHPVFSSFRGEEMWGALIYDNPSYPPTSSCPY
jgi:hypothetical protein